MNLQKEFEIIAGEDFSCYNFNVLKSRFGGNKNGLFRKFK